MEQFYSNREIKGHRMKIVRLIIKFQRKLDGKEFTQSKAYIIAGHGDALFDEDNREISLSGMPTFYDVKKVLGVGN
jgi:hypothetical protein